MDELSLTQQQLQSAKAGDAAALDDLFRRYLPRVRAMVAARMGRTLGQLVEIEDVVQETFRDAVLALERLDHRSEGMFVHWLARCVENNVRDQARRGGAQRHGAGKVRTFGALSETSLSESLFPGRELAASQVLAAAEVEQRIEQAMLQLGERYREVILLRVHGGLSHAEVAEVMGLTSENTANVLFLRAQKRLRELLEG